MSFLVPTPGPAAPPPPPPPLPSREDEGVEESRRKQVLAMRLQRGRMSTILTGGQGLPGPAPVGRKVLLGE